MAEDVKTLREAACAIPGGGMLSACERAALSILCARMADMIERETCGPDPLLVENKNVADASFALQAAEDRGWNAAIDAAINEFAEWFRKSPASDRLLVLDTLAALRREPRT